MFAISQHGISFKLFFAVEKAFMTGKKRRYVPNNKHKKYTICPGRSWPVLAGPRLLVFRKKSAPHPQKISLTEMRTKGRMPFRVLRLKISEKVFSENYETSFFRGPARTGQDRPGPALVSVSLNYRPILLIQ